MQRSIAPLLLILALAACDSEPVEPETTPPPPVQPPSSPDPRLVSITPVKPRVERGSQIRLQAVAIGRNLEVLPFARFHWMTSQPSVATVDTTGIVTAHSPGNAQITVMSGTASAFSNVFVVVNGEYPVIVVLDPQIDVVPVCEPVQFGAVTDPEVGAPFFTWRSSDTTIVRIDATGLARGVTPGMASVTALWAPDTSRRATAEVRVSTC